MRKIAVALLLAMPALAYAENVYVVAMTDKVRCVGSTINLKKEMYVLYAKAACPLPLVHAKHMRRFEENIGDEQLIGCWGRQLGDKVLLIDPSGNQEQQPMTLFAEAETSGNGNAKVTINPLHNSVYGKSSGCY